MQLDCFSQPINLNHRARTQFPPRTMCSATIFKEKRLRRASEHASKTRATEKPNTKRAATLFRFECRRQGFIGPTFIHYHPLSSNNLVSLIFMCIAYVNTNA
jgi:hypothetical protein